MLGERGGREGRREGWGVEVWGAGVEGDKRGGGGWRRCDNGETHE